MEPLQGLYSGKTFLRALFVIGIILSIYASYLYYKEHFVFSRWIQVDAQISEIQPDNVPNRKSRTPSYNITVSYSYEGTKTALIRKRILDISKISPGDSAVVQINPESPDDLHIIISAAPAHKENALLIGAILCLFGIFGFFPRKRKKL